jgi:hypothetical protein
LEKERIERIKLQNIIKERKAKEQRELERKDIVIVVSSLITLLKHNLSKCKENQTSQELNNELIN